MASSGVLASQLPCGSDYFYDAAVGEPRAVWGCEAYSKGLVMVLSPRSGISSAVSSAAAAELGLAAARSRSRAPPAALPLHCHPIGSLRGTQPGERTTGTLVPGRCSGIPRPPPKLVVPGLRRQRHRRQQHRRRQHRLRSNAYPQCGCLAPAVAAQVRGCIPKPSITLRPG